MDEGAWHPGHIYRAWEQINRALLEAMKPLPRQTLVFLATRSSEGIIRDKAAHVLAWLDNRDSLPDWGWFIGYDKEGHRCSREWICGISGA
jgi:hypothetical protein